MVNTCKGHLITAMPLGRRPAGRAGKEQTPALKMSLSADCGLKSEPPTSKDSGKVLVTSVGGVTDIVTLGKAYLRVTLAHHSHVSPLWGLRIWPEDFSAVWDLKLQSLQITKHLLHFAHLVCPNGSPGLP